MKEFPNIIKNISNCNNILASWFETTLSKIIEWMCQISIIRHVLESPYCMDIIICIQFGKSRLIECDHIHSVWVESVHSQYGQWGALPWLLFDYFVWKLGSAISEIISESFRRLHNDLRIHFGDYIMISEFISEMISEFISEITHPSFHNFVTKIWLML